MNILTEEFMENALVQIEESMDIMQFHLEHGIPPRNALARMDIINAIIDYINMSDMSNLKKEHQIKLVNFVEALQQIKEEFNEDPQ